MAQPMIGEIRVVDDVAIALSLLVGVEARSLLDTVPAPEKPFRLAMSGGSSGTRCAQALASLNELPWSEIDLFFVDERCVDANAPESNQRALREAFGDRVTQLHGFHPMSCEVGADAYEAELREAGGLDLLQLGFGPDGHTASLFPNSTGLDAPEHRWVVGNVDPSGRNPLDRLTLTYGAIAAAELVVIVVTGEEKREALAEVVAGADLPAARVRASRVIWLCDRPAADGIIK